MKNAHTNFLEDANRLLTRQVARQLELCRELLARDGSPALRELNSSVQEVARQLEQLSDFAHELRQRAGPQEFSLTGLVALAQELVEAGAQARDLEVLVDVHPSLEGPWVGDATAFRQVLVNTLSLAVQSSQGTTLNVALTASSPVQGQLIARLVVNGATLDEQSLPVLALRHGIEKLGGRVFTAASVCAVSLPIERPEGYVLSSAPAAVSVGPTASVEEAPAPPRPPVAHPVPETGPPPSGTGGGVGAQLPGSPTAPAGSGADRCRRRLKRLAAERRWAELEEAALELQAVVPDCLQTLQYLSLARVQQGGDHFPLLRQLAVRYFECDCGDAGRALLNQMLTSLPDAASGLQVAEDCLALGEFALAETFFREAADRYFAAGDLRTGLQVLERLQVVKPSDVGLGQAIGSLLVRLGDYRQAVMAYRGVLRVQPDLQPALEGLSLAAELAGDRELTALAQRRLRSLVA